ncbi:unnamed protein product [Linum trigynum]|uniref:Uncharacterized protein n=1 Tax=Linum trigynum TaxID=586398 RepID=A0AAV2CIF7_9ROSI
MNWVAERKGASKQGWTNRTLASISPPPFPLLTLLLIIFFLLYLSSYSNYRHQMNETFVSFKLFLLFVPVIMIFSAQLLSKFEIFAFPRTKAEYYGNSPVVKRRQLDLPWGMVAAVVFLLFMVSFQSSLQSMWSPVVRRSG